MITNFNLYDYLKPKNYRLQEEVLVILSKIGFPLEFNSFTYKTAG